MFIMQTAIHITFTVTYNGRQCINQPLLTEHIMLLLYTAATCFIIVFFCTYAQTFTCTYAQQNEYIAYYSRSFTQTYG